MKHLNPYLQFSGDCRQAMEFYKSILGGDLTIQTFGDAPADPRISPEEKNNVMHSMLTNGTFTLMAADMLDPNTPKGTDISLCIVCSSPEEIKSLYEKLSEGGQVNQELIEEFFGTFANITDKFGKNWLLQYSADNK